MSRALREKLRKAREFTLAIDGHTFTLLRPTDAELLTLGGTGALSYVCRFVVGWDLQESDFDPGGGPTPTVFDADLWADWVGDHFALWEPIGKAIVDAYQEHEKSVGAAEKN